MAEQTVREQLVQALERLEFRGRAPSGPVCPDCGIGQAAVSAGAKHWDSCLLTAALARARAEPEGLGGCICTDCPRCSGATNEDDTCGCWEAGHAAGLEAQRERVGRGTT